MPKSSTLGAIQDLKDSDPNRKPRTYYISEPTHQRLKLASEQLEVSMSQIIEVLVEDLSEQLEKENKNGK